jgi:hypothetical protein
MRMLLMNKTEPLFEAHDWEKALEALHLRIE